MTHNQIIRLWPNTKRLADSLKLNYLTVSSWKIRNRIPDKHWLKLIEQARIDKIKGVNLQTLANGTTRIRRPKTNGSAEGR